MNFSLMQEEAIGWLSDPWQTEWNRKATQKGKASDKYELFHLMALLPLTCLPISSLSEFQPPGVVVPYRMIFFPPNIHCEDHK